MDRAEREAAQVGAGRTNSDCQWLGEVEADPDTTSPQTHITSAR